MELILTDQILEVSLVEISENPWNPHLSSTPELKLIADSIAELGQIVPLLVVKVDQELVWDDKVIDIRTPYMLVDGAQRYKALTKLFAEGDNNALLARTIIIGNLSDYEPWELAELGQAANHARAKTEDDLKTGMLIEHITKFRKMDDYSRIVGQRQDYLTRTLDLLKAKEANAITTLPSGTTSVQSGLTSLKPTMVPMQTSSRGYHTVSLPFESAQDVQDFEDFISQLPNVGKSYRGLERSYKLLEVLKEHFSAEDK